MKLSDLAPIASLVSCIGVLISLIYVAYQIRQTGRNQRALIHQARASRLIALTTQVAHPEIVEGYFLAVFGSEAITESQYRQYLMMLLGLLYAIEDDYFQYREGHLEKKHLDSSAQFWKRLCSSPGHRVTWRRTKAVFTPDFVEFMDRAMAEVSELQPHDDFQSWKAELLAEVAARSAKKIEPP